MSNTGSPSSTGGRASTPSHPICMYMPEIIPAFAPPPHTQRALMWKSSRALLTQPNMTFLPWITSLASGVIDLLQFMPKFVPKYLLCKKSTTFITEIKNLGFKIWIVSQTLDFPESDEWRSPYYILLGSWTSIRCDKTLQGKRGIITWFISCHWNVWPYTFLAKLSYFLNLLVVGS